VCGIRNNSIILRSGTERLVHSEHDTYQEARAWADKLNAGLQDRVYRVMVLAISHVLNDDPQDVRDENLAAKCNDCHLRADRYLHSKRSRETWRKKRQKAKREKYNAEDNFI
jgi:hypothetical protein